MSYAGLSGTLCGDMPDIGQEMGLDPRARTSAGLRIVPTVWAQRAVNAAGHRAVVDGIAGPATLSALTSAWTNMGRSGPAPAIADAGHVAISPGFEGRLSLMRRVADPSGSTCGPCQWSACSSAATRRTTTGTTTGTSTTTPGASEPSAPEEPGLPLVSGGGLIARYGIWPWVIGGTALVGLGIWFLVGAGAGSGVRANRRRRMRRNARKKLWVWDWVGGGWNSALASSKVEAARIAVEMGRPKTEYGGRTVMLVPTNVRLAKPGEIDQLASGWD